MQRVCVGPGAIGAAVKRQLLALGAYTFVSAGERAAVDVAVCTVGRLRIGVPLTTGAAENMMVSNFLIPRAFVEWAIAAMQHDQRPGHILVLGSNAALFGASEAADYAAGKAALKKYCELRARAVKADGIRISLLNFGGVATESFWTKATAGVDPADYANVVPGARTPLTVDEAAAVVVAAITLPPNIVFRDCLITSVDYQ